jgi:L-threonylcarbamoyladenylate synthase
VQKEILISKKDVFIFMKTTVLKINKNQIDSSKIKIASEVIKNGGLVAFPTETVYGLGANGLDGEAVNKIFVAKGRPDDNPLILHIADKNQIFDLVKEVPENAKKLMKAFWPGPLTIILEKKEIVPDEVSAGLKSVAVRMPDNKIALALIKESGVPIAAPSANSSGFPSPTESRHVFDDLNNKIEIIIDGGRVNIGLESTVIDLTRNPPLILRPGKITLSQIKKIIGKVSKSDSHEDKPKCPGMKYKHYSPRAKVVLAKSEEEIKNKSEEYSLKKVKILNYENEVKMAKNLFKDFRDADKKGYEIIIVKETKDEGFGCAIMNRLRKASGE